MWRHHGDHFTATKYRTLLQRTFEENLANAAIEKKKQYSSNRCIILTVRSNLIRKISLHFTYLSYILTLHFTELILGIITRLCTRKFMKRQTIVSLVTTSIIREKNWKCMPYFLGICYCIFFYTHVFFFTARVWSYNSVFVLFLR